MNDELQHQLSELLAGLLNVASDAKQFAATQIPPLVQEKIALGRFEETFGLFGGVLSSLIFAWIVWKKAIPFELEQDDAAFGMFPIFSVTFGTMGVLMPLIFGLSHFHDFATVWFAPRLYIVEWLREMVRT